MKLSPRSLKIDLLLAMILNLMQVVFYFANISIVVIPIAIMFACVVTHFIVVYGYLLVTQPATLCNLNMFKWQD